MNFTYPAVFKKQEDGSYTGYFPDLDGCAFQGININEAINNAIAAEKEWITVEIEEGNDLPFTSHREDLPLGPGEEVRPVQVILHLMDGFDS